MSFQIGDKVTVVNMASENFEAIIQNITATSSRVRATSKTEPFTEHPEAKGKYRDGFTFLVKHGWITKP